MPEARCLIYRTYLWQLDDGDAPTPPSPGHGQTAPIDYRDFPSSTLCDGCESNRRTREAVEPSETDKVGTSTPSPQFELSIGESETKRSPRSSDQHGYVEVARSNNSSAKRTRSMTWKLIRQSEKTMACKTWAAPGVHPASRAINLRTRSRSLRHLPQVLGAVWIRSRMVGFLSVVMPQSLYFSYDLAVIMVKCI